MKSLESPAEPKLCFSPFSESLYHDIALETGLESDLSLGWICFGGLRFFLNFTYVCECLPVSLYMWTAYVPSTCVGQKRLECIWL